MYTVGMRPGEVYTTTRAIRGACPSVGTRGVDSQGREFIMVMVGASQNLTNGLAVSFSTSDYLTTLGTVPGGGVPNVGFVGIVCASITASTSTLVWAQVYGLCNYAVFGASASALPGAAVKFGADGGLTAVGVTTASAYIAGITCAATNSVITTAVSKVFLNYPKAIGG
jgi:hypothetical protein